VPSQTLHIQAILAICGAAPKAKFSEAQNIGQCLEVPVPGFYFGHLGVNCLAKQT